jgi:hypothetical protein
VVVYNDVESEEDVTNAVVDGGSETVGFAVWHAEAKTTTAAAIRVSRRSDSEVIDPGSTGMTLSMVVGDIPGRSTSARGQD